MNGLFFTLGMQLILHFRMYSKYCIDAMPDGFPIAPQWISPILTAGLTATECLSASDSAETAPARLHSWTAPQRPAYAG